MCVHDIERRLRAVVPGPDIVAVHKNTYIKLDDLALLR